MTYHFCNRIDRGLYVGGRENRKNAGVHNPKAIDSIHPKFFINNATFSKGPGFAGACWMLESGYIFSDVVLEIGFSGHVRGGICIRWVEWFEGRSVNYLPSVFDGLN